MMMFVMLLIFLIYHIFLIKLSIPIQFWSLWMLINPSKSVIHEIGSSWIFVSMPTSSFFPSSSSFNIIDALKLTKSRRISNSDLTTIDFDSIDVCDVRYLPLFF